MGSDKKENNSKVKYSDASYGEIYTQGLCKILIPIFNYFKTIERFYIYIKSYNLP